MHASKDVVCVQLDLQGTLMRLKSLLTSVTNILANHLHHFMLAMIVSSDGLFYQKTKSHNTNLVTETVI